MIPMCILCILRYFNCRRLWCMAEQQTISHNDDIHICKQSYILQ